MYRPRAFAEDNLAVLHETIRRRSFTTLAAAVDGEIHFAYAPVVLDADVGQYGGVRFHLARANRLAALNGVPLRLSFLGPDGYISPDWYATPGLVPTWNYVAVEAAGVAERLDEKALRQMVIDLSAEQEARLLPKIPWKIEKVPEQRLEALLHAIIGFSVTFQSLEGKFKLAQDKSTEDFTSVVSQLDASTDPARSAVANAMRGARRD